MRANTCNMAPRWKTLHFFDCGIFTFHRALYFFLNPLHKQVEGFSTQWLSTIESAHRQFLSVRTPKSPTYFYQKFTWYVRINFAFNSPLWNFISYRANCHVPQVKILFVLQTMHIFILVCKTRKMPVLWVNSIHFISVGFFWCADAVDVTARFVVAAAQVFSLFVAPANFFSLIFFT